jgi:NAD(P)-dependent dehydrogenase (short-subunit alcohol dehydrogenase family)
MTAPQRTLLLGSNTADVRRLAEALDADLEFLPAESDSPGWAWAQELEEWRSAALQEPACERIAVAAWPQSLIETALIDVDLASWERRSEQPLARWAVALGVASARCADGGSVVAVVDGPGALECSGWVPETAVAEGVRALTRSLALAEGSRGIRVNTVSTPARLPLVGPIDPAPPLASFPGRLEEEVAGAVRLLLSPDASGITGSVVFADAGRSWR